LVYVDLGIGARRHVAWGNRRNWLHVLPCLTLAPIEDVVLSEDLLCKALADAEDVAMGDGLLPATD